MSVLRICGWCRAPLGVIPSPGPDVETHGICDVCRAAWERDLYALRIADPECAALAAPKTKTERRTE